MKQQSKILGQVSRALRLIYFSRCRYLRSKMAPMHKGVFYIAGKRCIIRGEHYLPMLDEIVFKDAYQLRRLDRLKIKTIIDVGANIGIFSLMASIIFSNSTVLALEPNTELAELFHINMNGSTNYKLLPVALSSDDGSGYLKTSHNHTETFLYHSDTETTDVLCEVMSLDSIRHRVNSPIDLLKLDCEGSEYDILFSSNLDDIIHIVGELHTTRANNPQDAINYLISAGFTVKYEPFFNSKAGIFFAHNRRFNQ